MSSNDSTSLWAVHANEAGNEAATDEVLYSGLTRNEALATVDGCYSVADPADGINYYATPDTGISGTMPDDRMDWEKEAATRDKQLHFSCLTLLENVRQSEQIGHLRRWATSLQAQNDEAGRYQERDAVAVEAVMSYLRMAVEAAHKGLRK